MTSGGVRTHRGRRSPSRAVTVVDYVQGHTAARTGVGKSSSVLGMPRLVTMGESPVLTPVSPG